MLIAGAFFASVADARAKAPSDSCENAAGLAVLTSPIAPWKGAPLRVVFAADEPLDGGELTLIAPDGSVSAKSRERHGGPPYFYFAEVASPAVGTWHAKFSRAGTTAECSTIAREIAVRGAQASALRATSGSVWPLRDTWNRATENLYSAWIEKLFDAPLDAAPSWPALHEVLRDKSRNFLFNHLGLGEDEKGLIIRPDCADLPYFLRAYFAFKMGLPFGYSKCSRGGGGGAPKCTQWWNIQKEEPPAIPPEQKTASNDPFGLFGASAALSPAANLASKRQGLVKGFGYYLRTTVANAVHSGNGRTAAGDDNTDYYPVPLKAEILRPGMVYADPYGHVLVLAKRVAQTGDAAGVFLAVDGQPDGTVARKRFWRGNFLFAQDPSLGSPGFKRFRPIVAQKNGTLRRLTNAEIAQDPRYGDFSVEQSKLSVEDFYDRMDDVMSPAPLDPMRAMQEVITALEEQVKTRVTSVENGRKYQNGGGAEVAIPDGASIFETTGAWEDFSTPSRDLRLLIAIDVVRGFPDRVARRPERYAMPAGKSVADVKTELESLLASELAARKVSYTRSDGSQWPLALKDVADRSAALEMAYNVNDCVELRWGASDKSDEASTCKRRASGAQRGKMAEYRSWFHERRRPPRG
ncbi:MAG TPA: hypothetical protein VN623_07830 [Hyphomicrobium sp.]|jgi:hypothetical protein|uniref:hypothetical protein n=1 Tax=Hyphomicrobium sp. TaxID=82 RepID=UPI002D0A8F0E|nr:hypothetical protein [Hyphomicrobium sp.]HXE01843.1 hypothetical protein [Hyphomicrobium sp.]